MTASIHPTAIVERGAFLGADVEIGPYSLVGGDVHLGDGTKLLNNVTIMGNTRIGSENTIFPYSVIGAPPQDLKYLGGDTLLEIADRNVIREHVTMNVGTETGGGVTKVGSDNLFMCACHIAHDCFIGDNCIIANQVLLAGHIHVCDGAVLSGAVAIHHFVTVGEHAFIGGLSRIVQDVPPFMISEGNPARCRAVNVVGLKRNGFGDEAIEALLGAYRALFRTKGGLSQALRTLEGENPAPEVARLVEFMRNRSQGNRGRALQP